jgi:hypothetical protein
LVDTRWQQYSTHLNTNSTQITENGIYITIKKLREKIFEKKIRKRLIDDTGLVYNKLSKNVLPFKDDYQGLRDLWANDYLSRGSR